MPLDLNALTQRLASQAQAVDLSGVWSVETMALLREAGAFGWAVPRYSGGAALNAVEQVLAYEAVARGSLTAALILTQHDGACQLLSEGENTVLADSLLPELSTGAQLATVGISHLTTSKRLGRAALHAHRTDDGWQLNGAMPWVTSGPHCDVIVGGAALDDGRQMLLAIHPRQPGVRIGPVQRLAALQASATCSIACDHVQAAADRIIRGPSEDVLKRRAPVKSLTVSATGIGHCGAMVDALKATLVHQAEPDSPPIDKLLNEYEQIRRRVHDAAERKQDADADVPAAQIRAAVNDLLMRMAAALVTVSKGSGYLLDHPAQRLAREAMFFLVWSLPTAPRAMTLDRLARSPE